RRRTDPPGDRAPLAVRRAGADGAGRRGRRTGATRKAVPGADARHDAPTPLSRRRMPLPGLRGAKIHASSPHRVVEGGWHHRSGQPRAGVLLPSQTGPRARLVVTSRSRWLGRVAQALRHLVHLFLDAAEAAQTGTSSRSAPDLDVTSVD